ncbi:MAG: alpha/beta fold hydrolase [Pseudomonadota bacterium]
MERNSDAPGTLYPVFVATNRLPEAGDLGPRRDEALRLTKINVSVPAARRPGEIRIGRADTNPALTFHAESATHFSSFSQFRTSLNRELSRRPRGQREVIFYVHGFNNTFAEGVYRLAQLKHDLRLPAVGVHFSWPSSANPLGYGYDRDSILVARDALERTLRETAQAGADDIVVVAHSMGALLVMETLRQMAIADPRAPQAAVSSVVLISPDIDIDVFRAQARRIGKLPQPFIIFVSQKDRALRLSARLTGQESRLGNIEDAEDLAEFDITLLDVTGFSSGIGHFTAGTSPALIGLLGQLAEVDRAFEQDRAGRAGLVPGTVLTVQNATQVILTPAAALGR